jgi:rod shape-determining protein MreC
VAASRVFQSTPLKTFVILEFTALLIVSYQIQVSPEINFLEKVGLTIFAPFQSLADKIADTGFAIMEARKSVRELKDELRSLKEKAHLTDQLAYRLREEERKNRRLRKLLNLKAPPEWKMVAAEVIGKARKFGDSIFLINSGSWDGLHPDLGVICDQGVVGILRQVGPFSSKVLILPNPSAVIAVMTEQSSYLDAYSSGTGQHMGRLENIPNFEQVEIGEMVFTSGLDGLFPRGLPLGTISERTKTNQLFQKLSINFKVEFSRIEEVFILLPDEKHGDSP